ncbi:hypothetical protein [uncultured Bacteroides sp.]|uniref:hypothetical protein n=1 Tax=uncultured Bacteroides sp. TaxID=162156 RepID=UPI002AAB51A2|nr:hypothetical protein [uncultured Bacteroides sp.]
MLKGNIFILLIILSCSTYSQSIQRKKQTVTSVYSKPNIRIGHFTTIPNDVDGGSCCFYSSIQDKKKGIYVCVNDMASIAYLVINGKMERFTLINIDKDKTYNYRSKQYLLKIIVKKKKDTDYESYAIDGKMIVSSLNRNEELTFIGDCAL